MIKVIGILITVALLITMTIIFKPEYLLNPIESLVVFLRAQSFRLTKPQYLHNDPPNYQALPFQDILSHTTTTLNQNSKTWTLTTSYQGDKRPLTILLLTDYDPAKPTLIYHHGAGDTKPLKDLNIVFGKKFYQDFNTFVIQAQYHTSKREYLEQSIDSFLHHQETFAGSVLAYEEIIRYHRNRSKAPVIATGVSMGGIVSSLHAFYYGTANYYFPMVAYPNAGEIFLGQEYRTAVSDWETKRQNRSYTDSFRIETFDPILKTKVFPILGRHDKVVPFDQSFSFWTNNGFNVKVLPYGHFAPGFAAPAIRRYINSIVNY